MYNHLCDIHFYTILQNFHRFNKPAARMLELKKKKRLFKQLSLVCVLHLGMLILSHYIKYFEIHLTLTLCTRTFLKPVGSICFVVLAEPKPMLGMMYIPLKRLRTLLSIPLGFLQLRDNFLYLSLWWRVNFFALFLMILGLEAGVIAIFTYKSKFEISVILSMKTAF